MTRLLKQIDETLALSKQLDPLLRESERACEAWKAAPTDDNRAALDRANAALKAYTIKTKEYAAKRSEA